MNVETAFPSTRASYDALRPTERTPKFLLFAAVAVQAAHLLVLLLLAQATKASNLLQVLASLITVGVCLYQATRSHSKHEYRLWLLLAASFSIWTSAELLYFGSLFGDLLPEAAFISNTLWLFFGFPLVLVASATPPASKRDAVAWLDTAQAFLFFFTLYALVFPRPGIITQALAFQVQSVAMLLAVALSYARTGRGPQRHLYRALSIFVISYATCSVAGYSGWTHGFPAGTIVDLCWSLPFTVFSMLAVLQRPASRAEARAVRDRRTSPSHLRGISALGLAVMSLAAAGVLAAHRTLAGGLASTAVFLLFAARTSTREWQLQAAHEQQEFAALHDPLTGLGNRALLQQELTSRLRQDPQDRHHSPRPASKRTGLLFIDLDRFKTINDGLGHAFGDQLLIRVARMLSAAVRPRDIVARHGGDEFVVLLDQVEELEAEGLGQKVNEKLRHPLKIEGRLVHVTASIGLVLDSPGATADSMLQDADCAMYKAKGTGKDRAQTFAPDMLVAAKRKLGLESELRASLSQNAIEVQYQPIYRLRKPGALRRDGSGVRPGPESNQDPDQNARSAPTSERIEGFEALARWRHPVWGAVSPADFIPIAEDTGLILELGRQVLYQACCQCRSWNDRYQAKLTVSVNVSASQFTQPGLLNEIKAALVASRLDPRLLKLEITESVLLSGFHAVEEVLTGARALGIGVCLDDFGTGYSSLSYLLRFPFDVVKIDRSFVRHLDSDHRRAEMVRMVIQLAATLNKKIVAEGIESHAELTQLRELGCDMVQGFLLSRPLPPQEVELLLDAEAPALHRHAAVIAEVGQPYRVTQPMGRWEPDDPSCGVPPSLLERGKLKPRSSDGIAAADLFRDFDLSP